VLGQEGQAAPRIEVVPDDLREVKAYVTVPASALAGIKAETASFRFVARDVVDGKETARTASFRRPWP
jgi:hypothetical protein